MTEFSLSLESYFVMKMFLFEIFKVVWQCEFFKIVNLNEYVSHSSI